MANINDYLSWRGDLEIDKKNPFNEIDSMILARFSYMLFHRIEMKEVETIEDISQKMKDFKNEEFIFNGDKELVTKLGTAKRFKDMKVTDFVRKNEKETEKQFGAITIHNSKKEMYISYIGTDSTIYGWKEDFNMSFMDYVPCQIDGKDYFERIAQKYPSKKIRVGGHSKGGNVAIYSAIMAPSKIQDRIIKVYNYDGPGFNRKLAEKFKNQPILKKIETYFPQDSIIGRIMEHEEKCVIVESTEKGIMQHDIFSWQVLKDDVIKVENLTENSEIIKKTLNDWLENTTPEQRKVFMDGIFDLFYSTAADTFGEMYKNLTTNIKIIFKTYQNINDEEKKQITEMLKLFAKAYFTYSKDAQSNKFELMKEHYMSEGKKFFLDRRKHKGGESVEENIELIAQSSIKVANRSGKVVYFDPFKLKRVDEEKADIIFITHPHFDHFSPEDIEKIKMDKTKIVGPMELEEKFLELGFTHNDILLVEPNKQYEIDEIEFETIPAYNTNKDFHKKEYNWVGYIVTIDGKRIYVAGDTDNTEEARNVMCDIAMVPIGGTYTMTWKEAVELIKEIKPNLAIPIHYKTIVGTEKDAKDFKEELKDMVEVKILI